MKEEEEYDIHHENKMTREDFEDFSDMYPNASEIRDADPSMTKQLVEPAEEIINNLFNGDTGDFEEDEEYNPTEEENEELKKLFEELDNPQTCTTSPTSTIQKWEGPQTSQQGVG